MQKLKKKIPYHIISVNPVIIMIVWDSFDQYRQRIIEQLPKGGNVYFLFQLWWSKESEDVVKGIKEKVEACAAECPNHRFTFLCNTPAESALFNRFGLAAILCNFDAFVNEKSFLPMPHVQKRYDAVYTARITPFKRHLLASELDSVLLIGNAYESDRPYVKDVKRALLKAKWLNYLIFSKLYINIPSLGLSRYLNKAKVGLCLSAEEGPMAASVEYLLCGLPIVSTKSKGGRDMFFEDDYAIIVDDTPAAVKDGVAEAMRRNLNPQDIRRRTEAKISFFREQFFGLVQGIYDKEATGRNFRFEWGRIFVNKMECLQEVGRIGFYIRHHGLYLAKIKSADLAKNIYKYFLPLALIAGSKLEEVKSSSSRPG